MDLNCLFQLIPSFRVFLHSQKALPYAEQGAHILRVQLIRLPEVHQRSLIVPFAQLCTGEAVVRLSER